MNKVAKFIAAGALAAATEYATFLGVIFIAPSASPAVAHSISFVTGLCVSYLVNRRWVFSSNDGVSRQFGKYLALAVVNLILSNLALTALISLGMSLLIGKIGVMLGIACWNYIIYNTIIFRKV